MLFGYLKQTKATVAATTKAGHIKTNCSKSFDDGRAGNKKMEMDCIGVEVVE